MHTFTTCPSKTILSDKQLLTPILQHVEMKVANRTHVLLNQQLARTTPASTIPHVFLAVKLMNRHA